MTYGSPAGDAAFPLSAKSFCWALLALLDLTWVWLALAARAGATFAALLRLSQPYLAGSRMVRNRKITQFWSVLLSSSQSDDGRAVHRVRPEVGQSFFLLPPPEGPELQLQLQLHRIPLSKFSRTGADVPES